MFKNARHDVRVKLQYVGIDRAFCDANGGVPIGPAARDRLKTSPRKLSRFVANARHVVADIRGNLCALQRLDQQCASPSRRVPVRRRRFVRVFNRDRLRLTPNTY